MSNGFIRFLTRMMYLSACYAILCHATQAVTHKGTSKKRRCRKVCIKEFDKLKQKVKELEEKLELLLLRKKPGENFPILQGPKGDPGPPGPQGPQGLKGDCTTLGLPGSATRGGFPVSSLPKCTVGEYITSDGNKLYCVKLTNNQIVHTLPHNLQVRQDAPPPTLTTELKVQLQFLNKPLQTMRGDAWDLHSFTWNQNTYLGISQLELGENIKKTFILYKWVQNVFVEKADLTIPDARKWTSFEWKGNLYIVIACFTENKKDKPGYSYIYKMAYDTIEEYQKLNTHKAFAVDSIVVDGQLFIAFAYLNGRESQVFKWSNGIFIKHHKIPTTGSDLDAFHIGSKAFLAVVGTTTKDEVVYLLQYKNGKFLPFKNIRMDAKPYGITHFQTGNEHYLAIGQYSLSSSVLCRWNGETFQEVQKIDSCSARDFAVKTTQVNGRPYTYMVVINESCKPVVFVYEEHQKLFVKLQDIDSTNTRDVEFLSIPNNSNTLYLVVGTTRETTIYKESGS